MKLIITPKSEMKESGVEWIGEIPIGWKADRLKKTTLFNPPTDPPTQDEVPFLPMEVVSSDGTFTVQFAQREEVEKGYTRFQNNDIILAKITPCFENGKGALISDLPSSAYGSTEFIVIRPLNIIPGFVYYNTLIDAFKKTGVVNMRGAAGQQRVPTRFVKEWKIPYPSLEEQKKIVLFLNLETSKLRQLINSNKYQIELLREYEKSVIHKTVTKGLDPQVKMKDSRIEWIGEIPEDWKIIKLRNYSYIKGRIGWQGLRADEFVESGPYLITGMHFNNGSVDWDSCYHITEERYNEAPEIHVHKNDVLITKDGTIGKLAYIHELPGPASLNSHLLIIRPIENAYLPRYLYWYFQSNTFNIYTNLRMTGTTFYGITQREIENFKFGFPSFTEQEKIVFHLDSVTEKIHHEINILQSDISKIEEYQKSLIYEIVTGKVRLG